MKLLECHSPRQLLLQMKLKGERDSFIWYIPFVKGETNECKERFKCILATFLASIVCANNYATVVISKKNGCITSLKIDTIFKFGPNNFNVGENKLTLHDNDENNDEINNNEDADKEV
ncbi:hypothetical protein H8356DRAFT_1344959 [Neocallimastix lanati (nom. inval.)]|nr:hypothetical protein H8356DRAFT_1344959 [Neocallimastix sp. JGI-2020a]